MINGVKTDLQAIVRNIMQTDKRTRDSDGYLFLEVLEHICNAQGYSTKEVTIQFLEKETDAGRLPTFEEIQAAKRANFPC